MSLLKKYRNLFIWLALLAFAQILIYTMLFGELDLKPRNDLSKKLKIVELLHKKNVQRASSRDDVDTISQQTANENNFKIEIISRRKLERLRKEYVKFKHLKTTTVIVPNSRNSLTKNVNSMISNVGRLRRIGPDDIHISIKTSKQFHSTRLDVIRKTYWNIAKRETFFFTDGDDIESNSKFDGHLINTNCKPGHSRVSLCCKMQYELNYYYEKRKKRWFCHFDDDNYVNFPALIKLLMQYNDSTPVYLGKTSIVGKMQTWDKLTGNEPVKFYFATGGAGFCLSQKLVSMMSPHFRDGAFMKSCERIGVPDDCTIGFISENLLGTVLTKIDRFHSHLEPLDNIPEYELGEQISLSHGKLGSFFNKIAIQGPFNEEQDPSRFLSLHCKLFPQTKWCKKS